MSRTDLCVHSLCLAPGQSYTAPLCPRTSAKIRWQVLGLPGRSFVDSGKEITNDDQVRVVTLKALLPSEKS